MEQRGKKEKNNEKLDNGEIRKKVKKDRKKGESKQRKKEVGKRDQWPVL